MSAADAALVVAVIALAGTLAANLLATRAGRQAALVDQLRARTADSFREAFTVQHAMEWVTWHARYEPEAVDASMKREYDAEVHRGLPALLGATAAIAALSTDAYAGMQPILEALYGAKGRVALALRFIDSQDSRRGESIERLSALYDEAQRLYTDLPVWVSNAMAVETRA